MGFNSGFKGLISFFCESWCPHGGDSEDSGHLGCDAVSFDE